MIPSHAATIWLDADWVYLQLPSINGGEGHLIKCPNDIQGFGRVMRILDSRSKNSDYRIGTAGSPTKYQLEQEAKRLIAQSGKSPRRPIEATAEQRESTAAILRELGII